MRKRDDKKEEVIFDATIRLAGRTGIAGLTMAKIAKEAKMAHGTVYIYFENKELLLNKIYASVLEQGTLSQMDAVRHLSVKEQLQTLWEVSLNHRVENPASLIFVEQFLVSPFISEESKLLYNRYASFFIELLEKGKAEKIIKPVATNLLLSLLSGFIREVARDLIRVKKKVSPEVLEESFSICWDAIRLPTSPLQKGQR